MDAMANTSAGKDLAAMSKSFRVDRTGKLIIEGLRGKTCVKQNPNGEWVHWVESTGRSYGEGSASTLEACLRGCWREFILHSQSFRPDRMNIKEYLSKIEPVVSSFEGKALNIDDLQWEIQKIIDGTPHLNPIRDPSFVFDRPDLQEVFDFIGLKDDRGNFKRKGGFEVCHYQILGSESPLLQILPYPEGNNGATRLSLEATREEGYKIRYTGVWEFGGDMTKQQEYKDLFMQDLIARLKSDTWRQGDPVIQSVVAGGMLEAALNGDAYDMVSVVADHIKDVSELVELPEPLKSQVMAKQGYDPDDIDSISTSKELGII